MSIGALTVKANERVKQLGEVKQQLFEFLDRTLVPKDSETKKQRYLGAHNTSIEEASGIVKGEKTHVDLVLANNDEVLSLVPDAKVLQHISAEKARDLIQGFSALSQDLVSRNPVAKTAEAQQTINLALTVLAMQPSEEMERKPELPLLKASAEHLIDSLIKKDLSFNSLSSLDSSYRSDAIKILMPKSESEFIQSVTAFAARARENNLDINSREFKDKLAIELGGGLSGQTLALNTISRVNDLLASDPEKLAEKIHEVYPDTNKSLLSLVESFKLEQIAQFKNDLIRASFDRETSSINSPYPSAANQMQTNFNEKIHAWENLIKASNRESDSTLTEVTDLISAYMKAEVYKNQQMKLMDTARGSLDILENFNRATASEPAVDIEINKDILEINGKKAALKKLAELSFGTLSSNSITEDDTKKVLQKLISSSQGNEVTYTMRDGSRLTMSKADMQSVIDLDISVGTVAYRYPDPSGNPATYNATVNSLFSFISDDIKLQITKPSEANIEILSRFGGNNLDEVKNRISNLNEAQLDSMFDQLGAFTLRLGQDDKRGNHFMRPLTAVLEDSLRAKHSQLKKTSEYVHSMDTKANVIITTALKKNPAALEKLFNLNKNDENPLQMIAEHSLPLLAYERLKAEMKSNIPEKIHGNSSAAYEDSLRSHLRKINENSLVASSVDVGDFENLKAGLSVHLSEAQIKELDNSYQQRLKTAELDPLSSKLIENIAKKAYLYEAFEKLAADSKFPPAAKAHYESLLPNKDSRESFSENLVIFEKINLHYENKENEASLRKRFLEEVSPDGSNLLNRVLLSDSSDPLEKREFSFQDSFQTLLKNIFTSIMSGLKLEPIVRHLDDFDPALGIPALLKSSLTDLSLSNAPVSSLATLN